MSPQKYENTKNIEFSANSPATEIESQASTVMSIKSATVTGNQFSAAAKGK